MGRGQKLRILIFNWKDIRHPVAGGAEVYTHEVARRLVAWGHDVTLFASGAPGLPREEAIDGVHIVRRGTRLSVYRSAKRFWTTEEHGGFDVVIDEVNTRPFLTSRWVRGTPTIALVYQVARDVWFHEVPLPVAVAGRFWLERKWLRSYREVPILTICQSGADALGALGARDVSIIPVGLEPPVLTRVPPKEDDPTVLFVGRLAPNKRPADALAAFRRLNETMPDAKMWVVGSGPLEQELRARWASDRVTFFGRVDEATKYDLMARAHLQVVTSVREGWGMVVSEAAAVGTRSVAYDVAGLHESVPPSGGALVAPTVQALAEALTELLPIWVKDGVRTTAGGVASWDDVAAEVLSHLERATAFRTTA